MSGQTQGRFAIASATDDASTWDVIIRFLLLLTILFLSILLSGCKDNFSGMLNPKGLIAYHERKLFFDTLALMLIVVLPVIVMSFTFIFHYQASHRMRDYKPNWSHSYFLESLWWGIPCAIITVLAVITWRSTHQLDPYRPIPGSTKPAILIQAIALPWKWLFIYPQQGIATVNYLKIPVNEQIEFWMTTDNVPMSALFIPQLGSQIYAMAGMKTQLHLIGNQTGTFTGMNTQYNGSGFSDMHFQVDVVSAEEFSQWQKKIKSGASALNEKSYQQLLIPSMNNPSAFYSSIPPDMFNQVIDVYMSSVGKSHPRDNQTVIKGK